MDVEIKEYRDYVSDEILSLYRSVGWSAYYSQPETLRRAFDSSLCVLAAYVQGGLAGIVRGVGDGETIVFVQDLLVRPEFQRQGIGTRLMGQMFFRYRNVRQFHLMTDDCPETEGFYRSIGMVPIDKIHALAFTRVRY